MYLQWHSQRPPCVSALGVARKDIDMLLAALWGDKFALRQMQSS